MLDDVTIVDGRGFSIRGAVPDEARPDCESCEKPELHEANSDTVILYNHVATQQQQAGTNGHWAGVRMEAVIAVAEWLYDAGEIWDMDEAIRRIQIIDRVNVQQHNAAVDAAIEAAKNKG
jgi:hypothetical protein